jgi:nitrite reductase/ring-hydroxylating ferredoxin subunit
MQAGASNPGGTWLLCRLDQLPSGGCREFKLGSGDWPLRGFVIRVADGVRAYVNRCAHLSYPLNYLPDEFLSYDRRHILCTMHGALFEKETGLCVAGPCLGRSLISVPVRIEDGCVITDASTVDHLLRACSA